MKFSSLCSKSLSVWPLPSVWSFVLSITTSRGRGNRLLRKAIAQLPSSAYRAKLLFEKAIPLLHKGNDAVGKVKAWTGLALCCQAWSDTERALEMFEIAHSVAKKYGCDEEVIEKTALNVQRAIEEKLAIDVRKLLNKADLAAIMTNVYADMSETWHENRGLPVAIKQGCEQALQLMVNTIGNRHWIQAEIYNFWGGQLLKSGETTDAIPLLEQAQQIALEFPDQAEELQGRIAHNLKIAYDAR